MLKKIAIAATAATFWVGLTSVSSAQKFTDVKGNPYESEIDQAAKMLIISGFPDKTFRPQETVTREQAISMIIDGLQTLVAVNIQKNPPVVCGLFWMLMLPVGVPLKLTGRNGILFPKERQQEISARLTILLEQNYWVFSVVRQNFSKRS